MDWENERYVRIYVRSTVSWRMLSWQGKALWPLLLREVDRAGLLALDGHGARGLAALVDLPPEVVEPGLQSLLSDGCVRLLGDGARLFVPNFIEAQEAKQSDKQRQSESRERRRAIAQAEADGLIAVTNRDDESQNVTICHENGRNVTTRHTASQSVTPCLAVPSRAVPSCTEDPPLPPAGAGGISPLVPIPSDAEEQDAAGPLLQLRALQATEPKGLTPASFVDLWNAEAGQRLGRAPEGKRLSGIKRCLKVRPRREDWLPVLSKVKALRALPGTGWLDVDWLVRDVSHADRLVDGAFDWKLTESASKPHRHDGLERIDPPQRQRQPGDRGVHRCAICPDILPHTWSGTDWTPDPHTCAEGAMETP